MAGRGDYSTRQIIHSDESHSTERDQKTMSTTYDYDDINDQQSIISDSISVASNNHHQLQHSRKADYKKMIMKLNRLKEENAVLREHLEKAKAQDVATLRAQLRGANVDLMRYKQLNAELKDRIQSVEAKLFTTLGLLGEVNSKKSYTSGAAPAIDVPHTIDDEFQDAKDGSVDTSVSVAAKHIHASDIDDLVERSRSNVAKQRSSSALTKSLQSQCSHLQRLTASYEKRMQAMQCELDSYYHTRSTPHKLSSLHDSLSTHHKSVVIKESSNSSSGGAAVDTDVHSQLNDYKLSSEVSGDDDSIQSMSKRNSWTEISSREEGGAADKRIIRELSSEIKRLVSLIPREALQRMEEQQEEEEESATASFEVPLVTSQSPMDDVGSTDPSKTIHPSSSSPKPVESSSTHHWILSFVLGCLMSFIGIVLLHANEYVVVNWSVSALSKAR
jgi:hypothetical protein